MMITESISSYCPQLVRKVVLSDYRNSETEFWVLRGHSRNEEQTVFVVFFFQGVS